MNNQYELETYILENNINDYQLILNNFKYDENKLILFLLQNEKYVILQKKVNNDIFLHNIDLYDTKKVENIEKCAICYEESNIITNSNHQFCLLCINENYKYNKNFDYTCSYCRTENIELFKIINHNI